VKKVVGNVSRLGKTSLSCGGLGAWEKGEESLMKTRKAANTGKRGKGLEKIQAGPRKELVLKKTYSS